MVSRGTAEVQMNPAIQWQYLVRNMSHTNSAHNINFARCLYEVLCQIHILQLCVWQTWELSQV